MDGVPCADDFAAVIRREDVRGWEVDRVRVEESFAVGDVVRGVVVSFSSSLPSLLFFSLPLSSCVMRVLLFGLFFFSPGGEGW